MFRETMPLEDTWEEMLLKEFTGQRPPEGYTVRDLTDRIVKFVMDRHSINVTDLLVRGGFKQKEDIDRIAETGWDYRGENPRGLEKDATYLLKFHHMPYIHLVKDPFLNPLMHMTKHFHNAPGLVFYDPEQMVEKDKKRVREFGEYHFANPDRKKDAVVGIIEFDVQESRDALLMRILSRSGSIP